MSYGLVMTIAFVLWFAGEVRKQRREDALALAEAKRRHPAGRGRQIA